MGATNSREESSSNQAQGVSFDIILSPKIENARIPELTPKRAGIITREAIDEKMEAAERRRKNKELDLRRKLANEDEHVQEVRQAMSEYMDRKKKETEERYQRRLFIFAENQESIASERAEQWEEKSRRIEAAKKIVKRREKSFRETVKEKLAHKLETFKENHSKYQVSRQEAARLKAERLDAAQSTREKQSEEHAVATAEKIKRKLEAMEENREANIHEKVTKIQKQQAKVQQTKEAMEKSLVMSSSKKMMELEVKLDRSAVKRQLYERERQNKVKANLEKGKEVRRIREERVQRFSDCTKENLQMKFEKAEKVREQHSAIRQQVIEKKTEREQKVKSSADQNDSEKLREKIEEKLQKSEENRAAILNAKVENCQRESSKVEQTKENAEKQMRKQEQMTDEKLQAKLNSYRENRERRLNERISTTKMLPNKNNRPSLQEITNGDQTIILQKTSSKKDNCKKVTIAKSPRLDENKNIANVENEKQKELAENFRNRNLEYLGLR